MKSSSELKRGRCGRAEGPRMEFQARGVLVCTREGRGCLSRHIFQNRVNETVIVHGDVEWLRGSSRPFGEANSPSRGDWRT